MNPAGVDQQRDDAQRERKALDVVAEILEVPDEQRTARLAELCGSDQTLRDRVLALLRQITRDVERSGGFNGSFTQSTRQDLRDDFGASAAAAVPFTGSRIGAYQILRHLGAGGMGDVYEAEQDRPRRRVALKLLRRARLTPAMMRRFEYEAEWLGRLDHEGIARIYEAGAAQTPAGNQPYFALELIDGQRLDQWLREQKPRLEARVRLLIDLCDAVHHAHQRGIIHRDLKPANILVTKNGRSKILDFGVARAMGQEAVAAGETISESTTDGSLVGTLQYMSPEQVAGQVRDIDTRCDVYALGMIAYEILSNGRRPYELSDKPIGECLRIVRQVDPPKLGSIDRDLRGDLETIVAKALSKEKERRYASAAEFADDLRRYLEHEPVTARPPTLAYHTAKFARRHRALVTSTIIIAIVLIGGLVGTSIGFVRATRARKAEVAQSQVKEQVNQFLKDLLLSPDPSNAQGKEPRVRDILDRAADTIDSKFADQPLIAAKLHNFVGSSYDGLAMYDKALHHQTRARDLQIAVAGEDDRESIDFASNVAVELDQLGRSDEAEQVLRQLVPPLQRVAGPDDPKTLATTSKLAFSIFQRGRYGEAIPIMQDVLARQQRVEGRDSEHAIFTANNLALALNKSGRKHEAEAAYRALLDVLQSNGARGPDHPDSIRTMNNLACCLMDQGDYAAAEPMLRELVDRCNRVFGPDHIATLTIQNNLAGVMYESDRWAEAEPIYAEILPRFIKKLGADHPSTIQATVNYAKTLDGLKKYDQAEPLARGAVDAATAKLGPDHPLSFQARRALAEALINQQRAADALPILEDLVPRMSKMLGNSHVETVVARQCYAEALQALDRKDEATVVMRQVVQVCDANSQIPPSIADKCRALYRELSGPAIPAAATTQPATRSSTTAP
jgi:serine/threonine protein kinase/Flp pilus assembly protein TadD